MKIINIIFTFSIKIMPSRNMFGDAPSLADSVPQVQRQPSPLPLPPPNPFNTTLKPWQRWAGRANSYAPPVTDGWQRLKHHVKHQNIANYLDEQANRHRYAPGREEYTKGVRELRGDGIVEGGKRKSRKYKKLRKSRKSRKYRKSRKR